MNGVVDSLIADVVGVQYRNRTDAKPAARLMFTSCRLRPYRTSLNVGDAVDSLATRRVCGYPGVNLCRNTASAQSGFRFLSYDVTARERIDSQKTSPVMGACTSCTAPAGI
jgi:hypothetical protein